MKIRNISILLTALFVLSLLFGCTASRSVPLLSDCGTMEGMISHTSASKYSYTDAEGVVSTQHSLFVPTGTVISCEREMAVYTYDEYNTLNKELLASIGQATVGEHIVMMAPGTLTVTEDAYVRISVRGTLDDVVITYPADRKFEVRVFNSEYEAYGKDFARILPQINSAKKGAVNYIFLSDVHNDHKDISATQRASLKKQVEMVVKLANESDAIDFIVIGGDNTSGQYSDRSTTLQYTHQLLEPLKTCKKPVLMLMGNHDDNSYDYNIQPYTNDMAANLVSKAQWKDEVLKVYSPPAVVHDTKNQNSAYYYYDLPEKQTRLVCLDAIDYAQQVDENGNILASSLANDAEGNSLVGRNYWGYSARQLQWLSEEALAAGADWNYIFFSHMSTQTKNGGQELRELIAAFQNRSTYTNNELGTLDFTSASGRISLYQYGHVHTEKIVEETELGLWSIATGSANIAQITNNKKGSETYRAFGTDSECCFDIMSVTKEKTWKYAFGVGRDAVLDRPKS